MGVRAPGVRMNDIIATLVSAPFAVAVTALLRKRWPQIDGAYVAVVVLALAVLGAVAAHYRALIPPEAWTALGPLLATVLALGGVQTAQHVVSPLREDAFAAEAPTKKEQR